MTVFLLVPSRPLALVWFIRLRFVTPRGFCVVFIAKPRIDFVWFIRLRFVTPRGFCVLFIAKPIIDFDWFIRVRCGCLYC